MDNFQWILAYDGDNAGRLVGRAILSDNPQSLSDVSQRINLGHEIVKQWAEKRGGSIISGGGDEGTFQIPMFAIQDIGQLRVDYQNATNLTMSVGVGRTLSEAGKSLIVSKFRGKNQVVFYDTTVEQEILKVQDHLVQGNASAEEKKQGEAYLQPKVQGTTMNKDQSLDPNASQKHNCPYCQELETQNIHDEDCPYCQQMGAHDPNSEGHADDCPYCAVMNHDPGAEGHTDDCPYCQEALMHDPNMEGHEADCPYCTRAAAEYGGDDQSVDPSAPPAETLPTTQSSQDYARQDLPTPDLDKPPAISRYPDKLAAPTDTDTNENIKLQDLQGEENETPQTSQAIDPESEETVQSIMEEIDALSPDQQAPRQEVNQTDDANLAIGTNMEGNVSRVDSYSQDVPTDLGLGEQPENGAPDISSVLQEGLDNHSDSIQRERVCDMVGQALEGFKASKMILERAKTEAPQLYDASIAMLKAMIEMCKMLGLTGEESGQEKLNDVLAEPSVPAEEPGGPVSQQADPNATIDGHPDYNNLYPAHPDSRGGTTDPKLQGR